MMLVTLRTIKLGISTEYERFTTPSLEDMLAQLRARLPRGDFDQYPEGIVITVRPNR